MGQLETMEQNVINFHSVALEITYKSCLDALAGVGFVPNDDNFLLMFRYKLKWQCNFYV